MEIVDAKTEGIVHIKIKEEIEKEREDLNILAVHNAIHGKDIGICVKERIRGI